MHEWHPRYRAPLWLPGGNLQTLYPALLAPRPRVRYRRQRWDTPDGDFVDETEETLGQVAVAERAGEGGGLLQGLFPVGLEIAPP